MTDRANGKALHQQWQGRGRAKQGLLSHPTQSRLGFVLKAQTRAKMGPNIMVWVERDVQGVRAQSGDRER